MSNTATLSDFSEPRPSNRVPLFDLLFVISGGLIFALPLLFYLGEHGLSGSNPIHWYFWVNAIISAPHVYSTYVRVNRKIKEKKISWFIGFPTYFVLVGLLFLAAELGYFVEAMTFVNVWQSWHYLRQVYGIGNLYTNRFNKIDEKSRKLRYWAYHLAIPAFVLGRWDLLYTVWQGKASGYIIPVDMNTYLMQACWVLAGLGAVLGLFDEARKFKQDSKNYNPVGLVNLTIYFAIHLFGFCSITYFQRGFFAVTIFHAVQYLALVWIMERDVAISKGEENSHRFIFAYFKSPNFVGFMIFWLVLFALGYSWENHVTAYLNNYWTQASSILLAAISAHHYTVDSFIWGKKAGK